MVSQHSKRSMRMVSTKLPLALGEAPQRRRSPVLRLSVWQTLTAVDLGISKIIISSMIPRENILMGLETWNIVLAGTTSINRPKI